MSGWSSSFSAVEIEGFEKTLRTQLGLSLKNESAARIEALLKERIRQTNSSGAIHYLQKLNSPNSREFGILADQLAVSESYFFRNADSFQAISEEILPALNQSRPSGRPLNILSAGCAAGEEPYSLAILFRELPFLRSRPSRIEALDISPKLISRARAGQYSSWAFRELSPQRQRTWFRQLGNDCWQLDASIRDSVRFWVHNLLHPLPAQLQIPFDLILFRNVLIYLDHKGGEQALGNLQEVLAPDGFFFLGHAETAYGRRFLKDSLHLRRLGSAFYFEGEPSPRVPKGISGPNAPKRNPNALTLPANATSPLPHAGAHDLNPREKEASSKASHKGSRRESLRVPGAPGLSKLNREEP